MNRIYASVWCGVLTWFVGLGTVFSFNLWAKDTWSLTLFGHTLFENKTFFDTLEGLTANIMLPLGGLLIAFAHVYNAALRKSCVS